MSEFRDLVQQMLREELANMLRPAIQGAVSAAITPTEAPTITPTPSPALTAEAQMDKRLQRAFRGSYGDVYRRMTALKVDKVLAIKHTQVPNKKLRNIMQHLERATGRSYATRNMGDHTKIVCLSDNPAEREKIILAGQGSGSAVRNAKS